MLMASILDEIPDNLDPDDLDDAEPLDVDSIDEIPVVPLRDTAVLPNMVVPLQVARKTSIRAIEKAVSGDHRILLVAQRVGSDKIETENLHTVGCVGTIAQYLRLPDGGCQIVVQGQARAEVTFFSQVEPYLRANVTIHHERFEPSVEVEALMRLVLAQYEQYLNLSQTAPAEAMAALRRIDHPGRLADMAAYSPDMTFEQRQELLATFDPVERLRRVSSLMGHQIEILELKSKIQSEVHKGFEKTQRDYHLREQLKAIQRELGEDTSEAAVANDLRVRIEKSGMPEEVQTKALREVDRLSAMPPGSPETGVIRTYIEWLVELPWSVTTPDVVDLAEAERILNADHYGLDRVKERILEYIAVRKLAQGRMRSPILCFVGPPGVGKTSLGRSIAKALGRKFVRMSLGGVRDEAEIRGHRRTYVGALPGRVIQGMRNAGTRNPVFILDEIDKVGADFRGDPSAALLEVLDPEQNAAFSDHYLEVPFDLSNVIFIATANLLHPIPPALRDRMEVIEIPGYTEEEKLRIAEQFLLPKQLEAHGLTPEQIKVEHATLQRVIRDYTHEAGVRNLEREIANICRKAARRVAEGYRRTIRVKPADLEKLLGPTRFLYGAAQEHDEVGVATGVSVTPYGGDLLSIEVTIMPGKGDLLLTGQLGEVMQESARAALSYARANAERLGIAPRFFENHVIHVHVPAGAVPKDGPSAGITLATALISALTARPVRRDIAMTGEITLRGRVLPIGGVKEKVLAAHRAGIKTFLLPEKNRKDLIDVPESVTRKLEIVLVDHIEAVLERALLPVVVRDELAA